MIWWLFLLEKSVDFYPAPSLSWRNQGQMIPARPSSDSSPFPITPFHTLPGKPCLQVIPFLSSRSTVHPISSTSAFEFMIGNILRCRWYISSSPVSRIGPLCWTWAWWTVNKCCGTGSVLAVLMRCDETPPIHESYSSNLANLSKHYTWIYMNTLSELGKQAEKKCSKALQCCIERYHNSE